MYMYNEIILFFGCLTLLLSQWSQNDNYKTEALVIYYTIYQDQTLMSDFFQIHTFFNHTQIYFTLIPTV
jgi:hypothetical protein